MPPPPPPPPPPLPPECRAVCGARPQLRPARARRRCEARLSPEQLAKLAHDNRVLWIDRYGSIELDIDNARTQAGVNHVETMAGIDGKGMRGHIVEGISANHPEFAAIAPYR